MSKTKILHISQASGGVKRYIMNIIANSDSSSFEYGLISPDEAFVSEAGKYGEAYHVSMSRNPDPLRDLKGLKNIISIIKKSKPDLIHVHSAKGGGLGRIAAKITNTPCVFTPNAFSYLSFSGLKRKSFIAIEKFLRKYTTCFLGVSESEKRRAIEEIGYSPDKVFSVPNAINTQEKKKSSYELTNKIGMIGRLTHQKNPIAFVNLAHSLVSSGFRDLKFFLLGAGFHDHLRDEVEELVKEYGLEENFEILGWREESYVYEFFDQLDLFILTSKFEGLPFSLLEAMEYGLPCVVTDADGNRDTIKDGEDGFIVFSEKELFEKTKELLQNKKLRTEMGQRAVKTIETKHNILNNIQDIEKIYTEALNSKGLQ